jgi:cytochrome c
MFLFLAVLFYSAAFSTTAHPLQWDMNVILLFISPDAWVKSIEVLLMSVGITGIGMLFFTFAWEQRKEHSAEYTALARKLGIRLSTIGLLTIPLLVLFHIASISDSALSGSVYSLAGTAVILFFIAAHFIYGYHRSAQSAALTAGFALFLFASSLLVIGDTAAIGSAARTHIALLASNHEKAMEELKSKYGVVAVTFTGEDIYDAKCSACHLFDQKKVGPPYTETIPKYQGKKADLVSYILNPVQKNTAYPPMPNQGLRPAEADSIASYILQKVTASVQKAVK